jgi:hypothetical protein
MGWPQQYTESDVDVPSAVLSGISDNAQEKMAFVLQLHKEAWRHHLTSEDTA